MPLYDFLCEGCGPFEQWRPVSDPGAHCPACSAPFEGRISGVVDIPNACCSLYLPTAIFDIDIRPTADGPTPTDRGTSALTS